MEQSEVIPAVDAYIFAPNSQYFVYASGRKIYVKQCSVELMSHCVFQSQAGVTDIIISTDSEYIGVIADCLLLVYHRQGKQMARIETSQKISGAMWAMNSYQVIVFSELQYRCEIYNLASKTISYIKNFKVPSEKGCVFSKDGQLMALLERHECKDFICIYHTGQWTMMHCIPLDTFDAVALRWAPNDSHIIAIDSILNYKLVAVCPFKGVVSKYQPYEHALGIRVAKYSPNSLMVAIGSQDEKVKLINSSNWRQIGVLQCAITQINSKTRMFKEENSADSQLRLISQVSKFSVPVVKAKGSAGSSTVTQGVGQLQFSGNSQFLACRNDLTPFTVWIWDTQLLALYEVITLNSQVKTLEWSSWDDSLLITTASNRILFWSPNDLRDVKPAFSFGKVYCNLDGSQMLLVAKKESKNFEMVYANRQH